MAIDPINIGTTPDDHSGDPLRTAFTKVNTMFAEVYTSLALKAAAGDVSAALALLAQTDAELATLIAGKLDASALADVPDMDMIIRRDQLQEVLSQQRLQFAKNAGTQVVLAYELLPPTIEVGGAYEYTLPRLPKGFRLADANLTFHVIDAGMDADDLLVTVILKEVTPELTILQCNNQAVPVNGVRDLPVVADQALMNAARELNMTITFTDGDPYEAPTAPKGMTLFLRGVWTA